MRINPHLLFVGAFVPNWIMRRTEILPVTKLCYGRLCQYSGKDGRCHPLQTTLAEELGVSVDTVTRAIKELVKLKLLESVRVGHTKPNAYYFLHHIWMTDDPEEHRNLRIHDSAPVQGHDSASMQVHEPAPVRDIRESEEENHGREKKAVSPEPAECKIKAPNPQKQFTDLWMANYLEVFGSKYHFQVKDEVAAAALMKTGIPPEKLAQIAVRAWSSRESKENFFCKHSITIAGFNGQFNSIRAEIGELNQINKPTPSTNTWGQKTPFTFPRK